jgi:hypothetical protein
MRMTIPDYATLFDPLSLSACFLALQGVGDAPRHATGFFWRKSEKIFLITNWHVVTGINIINGHQMADGWCPARLAIEYFTRAPVTPDDAGMKNMEAPTFQIPLYEDFHSPLWLQHPMTFEWGVDIVAIEIKDDLFRDRTVVACVNDVVFPKLYHFAGSEIFVLGHPRPKASTSYPVSFPIWKRGSIASELLIPWDMRPSFLIDCRTSGGMSGSPVFSRVFGPAAYGDGTIHTDAIRTSEFMGIYSGRLHDDENNASLGLVWHRHLIDQILDASVAGSREWRSMSKAEKFAVFDK